MKAIVCAKHGPPNVLQLKEVEKPSPRKNEVLIKVHASTVTQGDLMLRKLHPLMFIPMRLFGIRRKRIPGHEFAGVIESVGASVNRFKAGDQVFGTTTGLGAGANAEYICLPEEWKSGVLAYKPNNISFEEASALPVGGMTALYILQKGNIKKGSKVLIYGASGSVGTYAVQLAKHHFETEVTGVCSTANMRMVKSLGADHVIDYTKEDISQNGQRYDIVFDAVGKMSSAQGEKLLKENGVFLTVQTTTEEEIDNLVTLKKLVEENVITAFIDKRFPLAQTAEAHKYVETGRKRGNVVITVVNQEKR